MVKIEILGHSILNTAINNMLSYVNPSISNGRRTKTL